MSFFNLIKNYITFLKLPYKSKEFVFYSESKYYRFFFTDLIHHLTVDNNKHVIYLSSEKDDINFFKENKNIFVIFVGNGIVRSLLFKTLRCKFMIMTLTDLNNHLKKSINCKKYIYFFHSPASTHLVYTKEAFKNYDIIFCNGDYHCEELRKAENIFGFKKKELVKTGYFFLDHIINKAKVNNKIKDTILFAPSWNYNISNLFDEYSFKIIDILLKEGFKVILRPHPEHFKRSIKVILRINENFIDNPNFTLDKSESNLESMEKSELLITDNSLIALEFTLTLKRPILYINYKEKLHNISFNEVQLPTLEMDFKKIFGNEINISNIDNISQCCKDAIQDIKFSDKNILDFKKKNFYNLGNSAFFASNYLINYSEKIK